MKYGRNSEKVEEMRQRYTGKIFPFVRNSMKIISTRHSCSLLLLHKCMPVFDFSFGIFCFLQTFSFSSWHFALCLPASSGTLFFLPVSEQANFSQLTVCRQFLAGDLAIQLVTSICYWRYPRNDENRWHCKPYLFSTIDIC